MDSERGIRKFLVRDDLLDNRYAAVYEIMRWITSYVRTGAANVVSESSW